MQPPEPEIITEMRQTVAERPALVPAMLIAIHDRDLTIAELEAANLALMREIVRQRRMIDTYKRIVQLPPRIVQAVIDQAAKDAGQGE